MRGIAAASNSASLSAAVESIADGLTIESVYVAMLAFELPPNPSESNPDPPKGDPALLAALRALYDLTEVVGDEPKEEPQAERSVSASLGLPRPQERGPRHPPPPEGPLASVRLQSRRPPYAIIVLTSTTDFAAQMGAPLTDELDPAEQEYVGEELYLAFERLLKDGFGLAKTLPPVYWGPEVKRWAAATTIIDQAEGEGQGEDGTACWPEVGVAIAGDHMTPPASAASAEAAGCIENALGSGLAAAEAILRAVLAGVEPEAEEGEGTPKL